MLTITLLSTAVIPSIAEMSASADAEKIINDLFSVRTAVYKYYLDHKEEIRKMWADKIAANKIDDVAIQSLNLHDKLGIGKKYIGKPGFVLNDGRSRDDAIADGGYGVQDVKYTKDGKGLRSTWYVGYKFAKDEEAVKEILKTKAKSLGLHFTARWPEALNGDAIVWLKVFGDWNPTAGYISGN